MLRYSASVDQAVTSVESLANLVNDLVQNNQDLRSRVGNLESSGRTTRSTPSLSESEVEDDVSTIRPERGPSDTAEEVSEPAAAQVKRFAFEEDLRKSRVYNRARRRVSLDSWQSSTAPSLGWSCLSDMSLANVSNISVIALPIAAKDLTNAGHYIAAPRPVLDDYSTFSLGFEALRSTLQPNGQSVITLEQCSRLGEESSTRLKIIKQIAILG